MKTKIKSKTVKTRKSVVKIRVALAEDHDVVREGLRTLLNLEDDIEVVAEARTGVEAVRVSKTVRPDLLVMDIALPRLNGIEATRAILKAVPSAKILILTAHSDDGYIEKALSVGVSGFLAKQCSPRLLTRAIREISKGKRFFSPSVFERVIKGKSSSQAPNAGQENMPKLSPREMEVLQLVAEGSGNKQIASKLEISIKTVEKHRQHLMEKLGIHDTAGLTRYAIAEGVIESSVQAAVAL
jgi:DNA-binding NarL/FixJ family response regulator